MAKRAVLWWVTLCAVVGLVYCALRRTAIREKFGIAGAQPFWHHLLRQKRSH